MQWEGGHAFEEMMMLGACVGSWGLQDQMVHFARLGVGWGAVDIEFEPMWEYDETLVTLVMK